MSAYNWFMCVTFCLLGFGTGVCVCEYSCSNYLAQRDRRIECINKCAAPCISACEEKESRDR